MQKMYETCAQDSSKAVRLDECARQDYYTNDLRYNEGLRLIRDYGYRNVRTQPSVEYYAFCNGM